MGRRRPTEKQTASGGAQNEGPAGTHERAREDDNSDNPHCATVTIQRTAVGYGVVDLTVVFKHYPLGTEGEWMLVSAVDEQGEPVHLTAIERDLAHCLVDAGVDDTGR